MKTNKTELAQILSDEKQITKRLLVLATEFPTIGFEASNHYFYNDRNLVEKILQTEMLEEELKTV